MMRFLLIIVFCSWHTINNAQEVIYGLRPACVASFDSTSNKLIYNQTEVSAEYLNGGFSGFLKYIFANLELPKDISREYHKVYFSILIEENGVACFSKLMKPKNDQKLEDELKRIINAMPKWKPAVCDNKNVIQKLNIPMNICLK